jgi:preprotein translocase subunit SecD
VLELCPDCMGSQRNNLIILGMVVVLIGIAAYLIFIRQPVAQATQLGLDLEGGVSVQMEGYQTDGSQVTHDEMEQAVGVIQQRVNSLGVTEPEIQIQGQNQVIVNIPGITDADRAVKVIGRTAQLGFYEVLATDGQLAVPQEGQTKILFEVSPSPSGNGNFVAGYVVNEQPDMTGDAVQSANLNRDQAGRLEVTMGLTREGAGKFADLTANIAENALAAGQPGTGQLAIVLDKDVISAPTVEESITGGNVVIQNTSSPQGLPEQEARELEIVLQTGALPVNMRVLSVTTIGPTLGTESLKSGLLASLVGFGLVLLFLIAVYRVLGVVADLALLIYGFLLWGLVVAIPVTMTLPGIAGIVLSIGVAADANIVIFERIKEEIRRGKTARTAVKAGYEKGFRAILDGNITTLITAVILFALSSGSVRGFAVLLSIGVVLSMFTAIVVTRALLGIVSSRGFHLSPEMIGVSKNDIGKKEG